MELGLSVGISPREEIPRFVGIAQQAEAAGVDAMWVIDSQFAMKDPVVAIAVALCQTESLRIGVGVANLATRHSSVLANTFATLSGLSRGRAILGVGAGDSAIIPLGRRPSTIRDLESGLAELRDLLDGEPVDFGGTAEVGIPVKDGCRPPIFLSASQPRMLDLAGRVADGVIVMGPANAEVIGGQLEAVATGARAAGRSPSDVFTDVWVTVSVDSEDSPGIDDVRSWAAGKSRWLSTWKTLPPQLEPHRAEMEAVWGRYNYSDHLSVHAKHAADVSDDLVGQLAVAGSVDECVVRLRSLCDLKPGRLTVTLMPGGRERRLDVLTKEVFPRLASVPADRAEVFAGNTTSPSRSVATSPVSKA